MKTFCPSCEKETNCVYIAELYECKECGCDFESKQRQMQERLAAANARAEAAESQVAALTAALQAIIFECGLHGMGDVSGLKITTMAQKALKGGEE